MATLLERLKPVKEKALQTVEDVGQVGLDAYDSASKVIDEVVSAPTVSAGVQVIGQKLADVGTKAGEVVGSAIDTGIRTANQASVDLGRNLADKTYTAITGKLKSPSPSYIVPETKLSNVSKNVAGFIGSAPGRIIGDAGDVASTLSVLQSDTIKALAGDITPKQFASSAYKNINRIGEKGLSTLFTLANPIVSSGISGGLTSIGADKLAETGKENAANELADLLGMTGDTRDGFIEGTKSLFNIGTAYAGIKGAKIMGAPAKGLQKASNVAVGTLAASAPDIGFALAGSKDAQKGFDLSKAVVPSLISLAVNSPLSSKFVSDKAIGKANKDAVVKEAIGTPEETITYSDILGFKDMGGTPLEGKTNAWNQDRYDKLVKSLSKEEQKEPIIINKDSKGGYNIDSGNHRFEVLKELGRPIKYIDGLTKKEGIIYPDTTPETLTSKLKAPKTSKATKPTTLVEKLKESKVVTPKQEVVSEQSVVKEDITTPEAQDFMTPPEGSTLPERDLTIDDTLKTNLTKIRARNELGEGDVKLVKTGNWLEKLPSLTFGGMLDAIKIGNIDFSSVVRGIRANSVAYQDAIRNSFTSKAPVTVGEKRIKVDENDLIGEPLPNDSKENPDAVVTQKDLANLRAKWKQEFDDVAAGLTRDETKALSDVAYNEEQYILMRNDKAKLDKYFTPEYQAQMEAKLAAERATDDTVGQEFVDRGLLSKQKFLEEEYVRFFLSDLYMKNLGKKKFTIDLFNEGERSYNSPLDALRALDAMKSLKANGVDNGKININEEAVKQLNSIFKDKSKNLDVFRFHSPTLRTLQYAKYAGQALRDADMLRVFESIAKSKDKDVQAQLGKMLGSKYTDNVLTSFLGLGEPSGILANTANAVSKSIMFGRLGTMVQALTSTGVRSTLLTGAKLAAARAGINPSDVASILNPFSSKSNSKDAIELKRIMESHGIIGEFELFDKGNVGKLINKGIEISSGAPIEQAFKTIAGLAEMQNILKANGITPPSNKALDIAKTYDAWTRNPSNRTAFFQARNAMEDNMRWLGDVSKMSKTPVKILSSAGFQALKPYLYGKVNNIIRDYNKIFKAVLTKDGVAEDAIGPASRQLGDIAIYYVVAQLAASMAQSMYNTDEEVSNKIGDTFAAKMFGGNPMHTFRDVVSSGLSNPAFQGFNVAYKTAIALIESVMGSRNGESRDAAIQATKAILSSLGVSQPGDLASLGLTDQTLLGNISDIIGAVNPGGQSAFGYASGIEDKTFGDKLSKIVNFNPDRAIQDLLYSKLGQLDYENRFGPSAGKVAFAASKLLSDVVMPIKQLQANIEGSLPFGQAVENRLNQYNVRDVMKPLSLDEPITLTEFIAQSGIDKDTASIIAEEIPKMWMTEAKSNQEFATLFGFDGGTIDILRTKDFGAMLKNLETTNPALFNSVISGFAKLKEEYDNQNLEGVNAAKQVRTAFDFTKESASTAAAISALRGTDPNITSLSNSIQQALNDNLDIKKLVNPEMRAKAKENLKAIDSIFATVYNNTPITDGIERSVALIALGNKDFYKELFTGTKGELAATMPNILKAMENGLEYRGFVPRPTSTTTVSETETTDITPTETETSTLNIAPGATAATPTLLSTLKAYDPLKISQTASQISPLTQTKTFPTIASLLQKK